MGSRSDEVPAHRAKKNRRHWCRGKVGTPHQPECRPYVEVKPGLPASGVAFADWRVLVCRACGKHLEYYYPTNWTGLPPQPPPPWVDK
jgi:hypothetical protein